MAHDETILQQAAGWAARTGNPDFDDWEEFTLWLEADPAHGRAYDHVMFAAAQAAESIERSVPAANDGAEAAPRFAAPRRWIGSAIAACLLAVVAIALWPGGRERFETAPGETRVIALADGGRIALAGGTVLQVDPENPREASLEAGQALFTIPHDPARPFRLAVGGDTVMDVGTVFDVKRDPQAVIVAVAEGAVLFNPDGQKVTLRPGQMLSSPVGSDSYRIEAVPPVQVGEWQDGRLTFRDAPLEQVAADLARATGIAFRPAAGAEQRRISGSVLLPPIREDPRALGQLLGTRLDRVDEAWVIQAP
ncbi:conserved hypothetical protein [Altererythrobacter sp. B11]|uniref:FecR family protein n=1 Tax=Altererythrobacter sp. B11 TaxID=2060312 RepID=UPI000DC6F8B5|nr:FecR domain-containing protein [Altererythrobacter sp. B11]BBC72056.1 conserved hypothetical protein [Altererythrobacter sp. B11]